MSIEINRNVYDLGAVCNGIEGASLEDQLQVLTVILNSCWSEDADTNEMSLDEEKLEYIVENIKSFILSDKAIEQTFKYLKAI